MDNKPTLNQLKHFVEHFEFTDEAIILNQCTIIENQRKFAESHLNALLKNTGNRTYLSYYTRLAEFYNLITEK